MKKNIRVLLIEDDEDDYFIIDTMLSESVSSRMNLDWAETYEAGLDAIQQGQYDVVLLDYLLGGRTGLDLLHEVNGMDIALPVILLTGQGGYDIEIRAMESGAADYLVKGQISSDLLERSIRYSIARKQSELELKRYRDHLEELVSERTRQLETKNQQLNEEIAERRKAEEALAESERRHRELVEHALDIVYTVSPEGRISSVNPAFESILGCPADEWVGKDFSLLYHPDDRKAGIERFKRLLSGEALGAQEVRVLCNSGEPRILELKTVPQIRDGKVINLMGTARDVTQRKQAENSLKQQKEFLTTVIESLHYPFYVLDAKDYTIRLANSAAAPAGLPPDISCQASYFKTPDTCHGSEHLCALETIKQTKKELVTEHLHYDSDGNIRRLEVHGHPILDDEGNVVQIIEYSLDITERKKTEEELKRTRDALAKERSLLHAVLTQMPSGVIVAEPSGQIILSNAQATEILEHTGKPIEHREQYSGYRAFHPDGRPYSPDEHPLSRSLDTGEIVLNEEVIIVTPGLERKIITASSSPVRDSAGSIVAAVVTFQDITARKRAEEELYHREQEYRALVENSPDVVMRVDRDLRRIFCNRALENVTGYPLSSFIGSTIYEPPREDRAKYVSRMEKACLSVFATGEEEAFEFPYLTTKGTRYFQMRVVPEFSREGRIESLLTIARDVTELRQIQEELRKARDELELRVQERTAELAESNRALRLDEARLEALLELSHMADVSTEQIAGFALRQMVTLTRSQTGAIGFVNEDEKILTFYACTVDSARCCDEKPVNYPIEKFTLFLEALNERRPIVSQEPRKANLNEMCSQMPAILRRHLIVPLIRGDRVTAIAVMGNKDEAYDPSDMRQVTILLDGMWKLVQRGKAEKALREAESLAAMGRALSAVAHDIKTPLIAIGGFTRIVHGHMDETNADRSKLEIVIKEVGRLETMLKEILDFSRPLELDKSPNDLNKVILESLMMVENVAREHELAIEKKLADLPLTWFDAMRMKQVIINLVNNAIQASSPGKLVSVCTSIRGKNLVVDVTDQGCGIPIEKRGEIFAPFFSTKKEGTGLGLPISKKIIEAHKGTIQIKDNPGAGVTFRVSFPAETAKLTLGDDKVA